MTRPRRSDATAVRLVAAREVTTRLRSKAWRIVTLVLVAMVVGFALVMQAVAGHQQPERVGVLPEARALAPAITATARATGQDLVSVAVPDAATARRQVADGRLDAAVTGTTGDQVRVVVRKRLDAGLEGVLRQAVGQMILDSRIRQLGGDPGQVSRAVASASVRTRALEPPQTFDPQRLAVGSVAGILIYLALIGTGQGVATGVVEEKSSRVVELLLATIRPWQLMAGKVLGIGLAGLLQVVLVGVAGATVGLLSGALDLSLSVTAAVVAWLVVWFVLGFTIYALVFAGLGALVSRQEEVAGATAPATVFLVVGYVVGISVLPSAPDNSLVAVLSLIPAFSPTLMPMRLAMGAVPAWQVLVALVLAVASIPLLVLLTGRLYRNGVVRTGARVSLRVALRRG
ncbi:MAG TPA: ABC transporter permease [Marmoricola sp.]